ncbi:MAG: ABC transporter six-transmembrane domain-containing protein, partial [Bacteroidota bacterium]
MNTKVIIKRNGLSLFFTFSLLLIEAGISLLFPLFIGYAIDDAIGKSYEGTWYLGLLGVAALIFGVARRVFDSRLYAKIYQNLGRDIISKMEDKKASVKTARLSMIRELVEFFEHAFPELLFNIIGLAGVTVILAALNIKIFYIGILVTSLIFLVYWITSNKTIQFN